jgi:hypothetical protein
MGTIEGSLGGINVSALAIHPIHICSQRQHSTHTNAFSVSVFISISYLFATTK